jgi:PEP-CTERM motif
MKVLTNLLATFALLVAGAASAQPLVNYTFSGGSGATALEGTFNLDPLAAWNLQASTACSSSGLGCFPLINGVLSSPLQTISGTVDGYSFSGLATLYVQDVPLTNGSLDLGVPDYWIIRSNITSPVIDGRSLAHLTIWVYTSLAGPCGLSVDTISLMAPTVGQAPGACPAVQYGAFFNDLSGISGELTSLVPVPEPSTYALMLAGLGAVGLAVRRRKGITV